MPYVVSETAGTRLPAAFNRLKHQNVAGYAVCQVTSEAGQILRLYVGSDDAAHIWLNGKLVVETFAASVRAQTRPGDYGRATEGRAERACRGGCTNGLGDCGFYLRLEHEEGTAAVIDDDGQKLPSPRGLDEGLRKVCMAILLTVVCPHGHSMQATSELQGRQIRCPECQALMTIPASGESLSGPAAATDATLTFSPDQNETVATAKPPSTTVAGPSRRQPVRGALSTGWPGRLRGRAGQLLRPSWGLPGVSRGTNKHKP